jgi:hypothetical protein
LGIGEEEFLKYSTQQLSIGSLSTFNYSWLGDRANLGLF